MPQDVHAPHAIIVGVTPEELDGDNQGVLEEVVIHHAVADNDAVVVRAGGKEWVPPVVGHRPNCVLVISEHLEKMINLQLLLFN